MIRRLILAAAAKQALLARSARAEPLRMDIWSLLLGEALRSKADALTDA